MVAARGTDTGSLHGEIVALSLDELEDSPFQVKQYDDARVRDLAETIRRQGLLQPATVRFVDGQYQLIAGHARRAALRYLRDKVATTDEERVRYATIPCLVWEDVDDARAAALTAVENLQRDDGTPVEQALMVAKARTAGAYSSVAETAAALGLPRGRVRQALELADAPAVLQQAVAPGVLVAFEHGAKKRIPLSITSVLAVRPYYDFLFNSRLGELKASRQLEIRRAERSQTVDDSTEARAREATGQRDEAASFAAERAERLLVKAARRGWNVARVQAQVKAALNPSTSTARSGEGTKPEALSGRLFDDKEGRLTIWPKAIPHVAARQRSELAEKLHAVLEQLKG